MKVSVFKYCRECGAECDGQASYCWICRHDLSQVPQVIDAEVVDGPPNRVSETFFMVMTLVLLGTAVLIGIGLAQEELGLLILYCIVAVPPLIATAVSLLRRKATQQITWGTRLKTLLISAAVTVGVVSFLLVAAIVALIGFCLTMMSQFSP